MPAPIILPDTSGLSEGISRLGSSLGQALATRGQQQAQQQAQQQHRSLLQQTLEGISPDSSPLDVYKNLVSGVVSGLPLETAQNVGSIYSTLQKYQKPSEITIEQVTDMSNLFEKLGMEREKAQNTAELWGKLTQGGQTELAKVLVDQISREQFSFKDSISPTGELDIQENIKEQSYDWPKVDIFEGRTGKEKAKLKTELLKTNNEEQKELRKELKATSSNLMRYDQLERINNSGNLPEGLSRLNIDWNKGELQFPWMANADTQLYVKTVSDFLSNLKNTFGARITNFEISAFMKRLPTLMNSKEGRESIIEQMKVMENLNELENKSILAVYDKYGNQNIDRATAERIAANYRKDEEEELKKQYDNIVKNNEVREAKNLAPRGRAAVRNPKGEIEYIPQSQIDIAKKKGYEIL